MKKTISFTTSKDRAQYIKEQSSVLAEVTTEDTPVLTRVTLTYNPNLESVVVQSIFRAGMLAGFAEAYKTETV
jgi:hypothetical protein